MKNIIKKYIENLTIEDVKKFIDCHQEYNVSKSEINIIYKYIKEYWEDIIDNKQEVLNNLKKDVSENTYNEIIRLLEKYKKFM